MSTLLDSQRAFKDAIFASPEAAMALIRDDGIPGPERLQIYRNNTFILLTEALADTFPVVKRLVGCEFFDAMAKKFILAHPPTSPSLLLYGAHMVTFIETFEPAATLPYLADVARLEWAWTEAYHAAEAEALDPATLDPENPRLTLHPSARFVSSDYPVARIWETNMADSDDTVSLDDGPSYSLVIRPVSDVQVRMLTPTAYAFFKALEGGASVADVLDDADTDLQTILAVALTDGTFSRNA